MKTRRVLKDYMPLIVPYNKPFSDLSRKEADYYFKWFLSHIDERAEYLKEMICRDLNISKNQLDYTLESTVIIWRWFLSIARISNTPDGVLKQLRNSLKGYPESFIAHMVQQSEDELSIATEYVLRDIGMYVSKLFIPTYTQLKWEIRYTPKSYVHVNEPLIVGFIDDDPLYPKPFSPEMEPVDLVRTPAMNLFEGTENERDLFDRCMQWINWIPGNRRDNLND